MTIHETDIVGCARCHGEGHENLRFEELTHPVEVDDDYGAFTHWTSCPTNGEPILMRFIDENHDRP